MIVARFGCRDGPINEFSFINKILLIVVGPDFSTQQQAQLAERPRTLRSTGMWMTNNSVPGVVDPGAEELAKIKTIRGKNKTP